MTAAEIAAFPNAPTAEMPPRARRRRAPRSTLGYAVVLIAVLFAVIFALMAQTVLTQSAARDKYMRHNRAIAALSEVREAMLEAETGQRGYLLTGRDSYLAPYVAAKVRLAKAAPVLTRIASRSQDPAAYRHATKAQKLVADKLAELDQTVQRMRAGDRDGAMALVDSDLGKRQMDALRAELDWLSVEEGRQLRQAFDRSQTLGARLLPLIVLLGTGMAILLGVALRAARELSRTQVEAEKAAALAEANERTQLLARELNHRVKNLFSVVLSIVTISGRKNAPGPELVGDIRARIHALSLAHATSQGAHVEQSPQLGEVIRATLRPYADDSGTRVQIAGPNVELPVRMVTPMGLLVHELATNAMKYGALSAETGQVKVAWDVSRLDDGREILQFVWKESGGPALKGATPAGGHRGFGSRLVELAAQQMGGTVDREFPESGAVVRLSCPLPADMQWRP